MEESKARHQLLARGLLIAGGVVGSAITPPFALSYYRAYGGGEMPPAWLAALRQPLQNLGVLGASPVRTYANYGLAYGAALLAVLVAVVVLSRRWKASSQLESAGGRMAIAGLALVTFGVFTDYGLPENAPIPNFGFPLQIIGFLVVAAATVLLGAAMRIKRRLSTVTSVVIGALGPVGLVLGGWAVNHLPSGPGTVIMLLAVIVGITGVPRLLR